MTVFKGGSRNPRNYLFSGEFQERVQTMNRLQPIGQLKQSIKGHPLVTKRITRGAQSAAQNTGNWPSTGWGNLSDDDNTCHNGLPKGVMCPGGTSVSICGGPCFLF